MGNEQVQLEFVTTENGELRRYVLQNPEDFELMSRAKKEAYKMKKRYESSRKEDKRGPFVMGRNDSIQSLETTEMTVPDRRYFMILVLYAQFDGEPLKKDGKPLTVQDIAKIWNVTRVNAGNRLNKFVRLGLLEKIKAGRSNHFVLNELYFQKGKAKFSPGEKFVKLFQNKLAEIIEEVEKQNAIKNRNRKNPTDIGDVIGLLHAVMPYFHYETYYLVRNPDDRITREGETVRDALERDPKALKHLSKAHIGRVLGNKRSNPKTIDAYMKILTKAGAVMKTETKSRTRYIIHPDLMFRLDSSGEDDYTRHIRTQFNQHN